MTQTNIDKDFGIFQFVEDFDGNGFWVGKITFKEREVDIHFEASVDCPTLIQRDFLKQVDNNYETIVSNIHNVLPKKLKEDSQLAEAAIFVERFKPKAILISNEDFEAASWGITFQSMENHRHFLCVDFKGFLAKKSFLEK